MTPKYSSTVLPILRDFSAIEKAISIFALPQSKFLLMTLESSGLWFFGVIKLPLYDYSSPSFSITVYRFMIGMDGLSLYYLQD